MSKFIAAGVGLFAILSASTASAADAKLKQRVVKAPVAAPVLSWTGFYLGGHVGYLWGKTRVEENGVVTEPGAPTNGVVGGVLGGYNWQTGAYVFGVEADIGWTNAHRTGKEQTTFIETPNQYDVRWTSHVRARGGLLYYTYTLIYVAGGAALGHIQFKPRRDIC